MLDPKDREAIQTTLARKGLRRTSRSFNRREYLEREDERARREMKQNEAKAAANTLQIRVQRGTREDSMATMEVIPSTVAAVLEYLNRHYARVFTPAELRTKLYARGAPRVDWDYIFIIESDFGVLAFTDRKVEFNN